MAEEEAPEEGKKKGNMLPIIIGGVAGALLLGVGVGVGWFISGGGQKTPEETVAEIAESSAGSGDMDGMEGEDDGLEEVEPSKMPKEVPVEEKFETTYYEFPEPFTNNLAGSKKFGQVTLGIATQYDSKVIENLEKHKLALIDAINGKLSEMTEADLTGLENRRKVAIILQDLINETLEELEDFGGIEKVFFKKLVIQ